MQYPDQYVRSGGGGGGGGGVTDVNVCAHSNFYKVMIIMTMMQAHQSSAYIYI